MPSGRKRNILRTPTIVLSVAFICFAATGIRAGADVVPDAPAIEPIVAVHVTGDEIRTPLTSVRGNPSAGLAVVMDRKLGNCLGCHSFPVRADDQGNVGPDLHGVGSRLKAAQFRLRVVNMKLIDPQTIMPAYYRVDGLHDVGKAFVGKTILTAQQVEDVVAYLATLKTGAPIQ